MSINASELDTPPCTGVKGEGEENSSADEGQLKWGSDSGDLEAQGWSNPTRINPIYLFVGNLPFQVSDKELFLFFSNRRINIEWAKVKKTSVGQAKGWELSPSLPMIKPGR
ncbi:hypothetical protein B0H13DRAFT_1878567 [Mycena leptocephala]|nr:hypothetical protein B0H13DRAFT_1878567 [Mycena leptocephala]